MARKGLGTLLSRAHPVHMYGLHTLDDAAKRKGVSYNGLRAYLRYHPEVPLLKLGTILLLRTEDLEKLQPVE